MEPYQKATESLRAGEEYPLHILKNAGLTALGGGAATAGSKAVGSIMPAIGALINQYVPENISKAGLNKIDPRFGKFLQGAMDEGYSFDELRNYLGDKVKKSEESTKENRNIIEQYDPELHTYIQMKLKEGLPLMEAGKKALGHGRFKNAVDKLIKDHKTSWDAILQSVYGAGDKAQQGQQQPPPPQDAQGAQGAQPGQGAQALAKMIQDINNKMNQKLGQ